MWLQMISLTAAISLANGMCFGVPLLQQSVVCPDSKIYYPQLCICLEPKILHRFHEIDSIRKAPSLINGFMDSSQSVQSKLDAIRYRLTASLPDMSTHRSGIVFPDGNVVPPSHFYTVQNHVPRSWRIGGLLESWSHDALAGGEIPLVNTGGVFSSTTSGWGKALGDLSTLSLIGRLHTLRNLWREANQAHANSKRGDTALAQQFFKNLPNIGISPDTARSYFHYEAGIPDTIPQNVLKYRKATK